jgi:hypothetical protein
VGPRSQISIGIERRSVVFQKPSGVSASFDKVVFWLPRTSDRATTTLLKELCGSIFVEARPARFNSHYRQRVQLTQPSAAALRWLAEQSDALINSIELALDLSFPTLADRDDAGDFLHRHLVRPWHGSKQKVRMFVAGTQGGLFDATERLTNTRYDAGRWSANQIVLYKQDHSRVTGELNCLHLEWRLNRLKAVRAAGLASGSDLLTFSHRDFWQEKLKLHNVDPRLLGRLIRNADNRTRRRAFEIKRLGQYRVNLDGRTGEVFVRSFYTVQELIDHLKGRYRIYRAMVPFSNDTFLPD